MLGKQDENAGRVLIWVFGDGDEMDDYGLIVGYGVKLMSSVAALRCDISNMGFSLGF